MSERSPQQAYLGLQKLARAQQQTTQQLFELYVHERFLARVAESPFAERLVLKGGMLLAVLDARRATRDADLLARGIANDEQSLRQVVGEIAQIELVDGVRFDTAGISIVVIREEARLPERFADVVDRVVEFVDGVEADDVARWSPTRRRWE